ncbi:hypothetical protein NM208_g10488 [Fusarium decemcellulare]|uniref:Uncharacterized protein n=1 Tax=Fusarium decemcellulare TaxID=57161 RepID=A0ACC1RXW4_9HYPO|nr:hypothetical protein NM208_g10488 [Fusarium decemcellulare]
MEKKAQLCETCAPLKLHRDKFIIQKVPSSKRAIARARQETSGPSDPIPIISGGRGVELGKLSEHRARQASCNLCYLIAASVAGRRHGTSPNLESPEDPSCSVKWEIDGRAALDGDQSDTINKTRRIRVCWDKPEFKSHEAYLVLVADYGKNLPKSDMHSMGKDHVQYLGRTIDSPHGNQSLAVSWMRLCKDRHGHLCNGPRPPDMARRFYEMVSQSYFGVIDVTNLQLTRLPLLGDTRNYEPTSAPYVALSYVWGDVNSDLYKTKRSNILTYRSHGGLEQVFTLFPKTIQDAIRFVRQLGIQFIWIDSLCIVQDSPRSWKLNAENMDLIYGFSTLTICAADGNDATAGLRATEVQEHDSQHSRTCASGVTLMISWPPENRIKDSKWNRRAWTFQERLLSPRCLIFVDGRIYWQCRSNTMSEDIFRDGQGASWSLDLIQTPLQLLGDLTKRAFWFYIKCLPLYTARHLKFEDDILAAFNGVSRLMERYLEAPFVFGIPTSHLDLALLWQPDRSAARRKPKDADLKWKDLNFPSWSWCGWKNAQMSYEPETLKGCLDDVQSWLMNHTWICWYLRDGHGNLRPLWDKYISKECRHANTIDPSRSRTSRGSTTAATS